MKTFAFILTITANYCLLIAQSNDELIQGEWNSKGCETCKWIFKDGICSKIHDGDVYGKYKYIITEGKSLNGKLTHHFLTLTDISNPKESYEYEINGLSEKRMALEYLKGTRRLQYFTKE
ncbi:hypothetical protein [Ekhidna sp.]